MVSDVFDVAGAESEMAFQSALRFAVVSDGQETLAFLVMGESFNPL